MDEELKAKVLELMRAGESDEFIRAYVDGYKKKSKKNTVTTTTASPSEAEEISTTSDTEPQEAVQPLDSSDIQSEFESSDEWVQDPLTESWSQETLPIENNLKQEEPKKNKFSTYLQNKTNLKLSENEEEVLKGNVEFTNYPGKEDNRYYVRNGEWFRQTSDGDGSYNKVINDGSINALNNFFLKGNAKEASLILQKSTGIENSLSGGEIYTGLPGKEGNEYKTRSGRWQRKAPGDKNFKNVVGEGATEYLNNYFLSNEELEVQDKKVELADSNDEEAEKERKTNKDSLSFSFLTRDQGRVATSFYKVERYF